MSTQEQLAQQLADQGAAIDAIIAEVGKVSIETQSLQALVATLNQEIANQANVSPALQAAADAVTAKLGTLAAHVKAVDDLVPDAPPTPAPEPAPAQ